MYLILGLGNPGPEFELTRHNIGFMVIDTLAEKYGVTLDTNRHFCQYGAGIIEDHQVIIAKPMTYMNESGMAAKALLAALQIPSHQIMVVYDEIDLILGKIKVRYKGGDAGNRGIRSLLHRLRTEEFARVRVGVGRPEDRKDIVDYVLSPFLENEWPMVNKILEKAVEKIEATLTKLNHKRTQSEEETE